MTKILLVLNLIIIALVVVYVTSQLNALDRRLESVQKLIAEDMSAPDPMYDDRLTPPTDHNYNPFSPPAPGDKS